MYPGSTRLSLSSLAELPPRGGQGWLDALCGMVQTPSECLRRLCTSNLAWPEGRSFLEDLGDEESNQGPAL